MEQISDYIIKGRGGKSVPAADISRLVSAAEALRNLAPKAFVKNGVKADTTGP